MFLTVLQVWRHPPVRLERNDWILSTSSIKSTNNSDTQLTQTLWINFCSLVMNHFPTNWNWKAKIDPCRDKEGFHRNINSRPWIRWTWKAFYFIEDTAFLSVINVDTLVRTRRFFFCVTPRSENLFSEKFRRKEDILNFIMERKLLGNSLITDEAATADNS